ADLRHDLPRELTEILNRMMAKDAAARYQSPAEVVKALALFAKPAPVHASEDKREKREEPKPAPQEVLLPLPKGMFLARCGYCPNKVRLPERAVGASVLCPKCGNYFTAVPEEDDGAGKTPTFF